MSYILKGLHTGMGHNTMTMYYIYIYLCTCMFIYDEDREQQDKSVKSFQNIIFCADMFHGVQIKMNGVNYP